MRRAIGHEGDGNPSALGAGDTRFDSGVPDQARQAQAGSSVRLKLGRMPVRPRRRARGSAWPHRPWVRMPRSQRGESGSSPGEAAAHASEVLVVTLLPSKQRKRVRLPPLVQCRARRGGPMAEATDSSSGGCGFDSRPRYVPRRRSSVVGAAPAPPRRAWCYGSSRLPPVVGVARPRADRPAGPLPAGPFPRRPVGRTRRSDRRELGSSPGEGANAPRQRSTTGGAAVSYAAGSRFESGRWLHGVGAGAQDRFASLPCAVRNRVTPRTPG